MTAPSSAATLKAAPTARLLAPTPDIARRNPVAPLPGDWGELLLGAIGQRTQDLDWPG